MTSLLEPPLYTTLKESVLLLSVYLFFSKKSILEILLIVGYESQQGFINVFKQMYKKTPNEYRMNEEFYPL